MISGSTQLPFSNHNKQDAHLPGAFNKIFNISFVCKKKKKVMEYLSCLPTTRLTANNNNIILLQQMQ